MVTMVTKSRKFLQTRLEVHSYTRLVYFKYKNILHLNIVKTLLKLKLIELDVIQEWNA